MGSLDRGSVIGRPYAGKNVDFSTNPPRIVRKPIAGEYPLPGDFFSARRGSKRGANV
jgi:hypothetical protein